MSGPNCPHCRNGWFDPKGRGFYFGEDVECVNGVLIDIDEAHEGVSANVVYPVAPCHPMWERQRSDPDGESWPNDSIQRLREWRESADPPSPSKEGYSV